MLSPEPHPVHPFYTLGPLLSLQPPRSLLLELLLQVLTFFVKKCQADPVFAEVLDTVLGQFYKSLRIP